MKLNADTVIVGSGVAGLFSALNLPREQDIILITKSDLESSDSFLAQGGICVLRDESDYDSYFEDTMKAGHYENRKESVEILFHEDVTGKEITSKLLAQVKKLENVKMYEYTEMTDVIIEDDKCVGIKAKNEKGTYEIYAENTILASGGIGGTYQHSTNFPHLTGDAIEIAKKHGIRLEHLDYVQIHPTTLYSKKPGRRFLISESVRGEGAVLYNKNKERFVDELLPRDVVTKAIREEMEKEGTDHVWLSMEHIPKETILKHFPNIYEHCLEEGYDVTKECIPVVPAQHYFMGGIWVDSDSRTSMEHLYAVGETSCNGVHGANRLASNSLLESLVFAKRAATKITKEETQEKISERKAV